MADNVASLKEQLKALLEARKVDVNVVCFKGEPVDDALQRFLQARKFDVEAAAMQITSAVQWRQTFASKCLEDGKANCLGAEVDEVSQFYRGNYAGHSKEGWPIWYEQTGQVDIPALHCLTTNTNFTRFHVCLMEELQDKYAEASARSGKTVNKTMSIIDLEGVTLAKLSSETLEFVKAISKVDSDNYPETLGKMFIINSPGIFSFAWGIIQGFVDPRTVSKIELLGGPEVWKPRLAEFIEQDQLPSELGGTGPPCLTHTPAFQEVNLASGTDTKAEVAVDDGEDVQYKFFTRAGGNITFKVSFRPEGGPEVVMVAPRDVPAEECSNGRNVSGSITSPGKGTIVATWEHPGWWSRQVLYRVRKLQQ